MTAPPPPPPGRDHHTVSRGLTGTMQGFFYAVAATSLAGAIATYNEVQKFNDYIGGRGGRTSAVALSDAQDVSQGVIGLFAICALVLIVLSIIWWYQSYQAIERTGATGRSWSSGWAIGAWFIPVANFIIPKLVLNEIDRVSQAAEEGSTDWQSRPLLANANLWWIFFVIGGALLIVGSSVTQDQIEAVSFNARLYRAGLWLTALGLLADVPAALFGASSLRTFGERLNR